MPAYFQQHALEHASSNPNNSLPIDGDTGGTAGQVGADGLASTTSYSFDT